MISIILPTYNSEKYIAEALASILKQTFKDFEFLIIDDGSTDNTEQIVHGFTDNRIKYIKKKHSGLADSLNFGLNIAKFEWIARMDADDISHHRRLEKQVKIINSKHEVDWISNWYAIFTNELKSIIRVPEDSNSIRNNLILTNSVCFGSSIFKKKLIKNTEGFNGEFFEDYKLLLKIKDSCNFYNIQEVLYYQRKRKNSLSRDNYQEKIKIIYEIQKPYYENLIEEFSLVSVNEENYFKGWREFLFGSKSKSRFYWNKLGIKIFFFPKAIIGWFITLFPIKNFLFLKKIGFKMVLFYSPFVSKKVKADFHKIQK